MTATFVDTSLWLALVDPRDAHHVKARSWLEAFDGRILTSTDILDEVVTLVAARLGHRAATEVGGLLQRPDEVELVVVDRDIQEAAWALFLARPDKPYSLTDCTSFVMMRRLGLREAATFDDDFVQAGFAVVP